MALRELWFVLVGVLTTGYFILEGFDYGVGMLHPWLNHTDTERRASLSSIAPIWAANEVWLVAAGGALFAAFPNWYATMFSGFYLALILVLLGLIVRGVGMEFRSQDSRRGWRGLWDWLIFSGSLVVTIIWGMAFSNLLRGVPINRHMIYVGTFGTLFNGFSLWGALTFVLLFIVHGGGYLAIKGDAYSRKMGRLVESKLIWPATGAMVVWFIWMDHLPSSQGHVGDLAIILQGVVVLGLLMARLAGYLTKDRWAFAFNSLSIAVTIIAIFRILFPRVMVSSLNAAWNLTINNTASTAYTLGIMSVTAIVILPIIIGYQSWLYWTFRRPVNDQEMKY